MITLRTLSTRAPHLSNSRTTALWFICAAIHRGDALSSLFWSTVAPPDINICATRTWPFCAAMNSGLAPSCKCFKVIIRWKSVTSWSKNEFWVYKLMNSKILKVLSISKVQFFAVVEVLQKGTGSAGNWTRVLSSTSFKIRNQIKIF